MSFTSPAFLVFLVCVLVGCRLLSPGRRWRLLLPASYFFYACHDPWLLGLILATTLVSYGAALRIERAGTRRQRRAALAADLIVCLGVLFVFKYLDFALRGAVSLLNLTGASLRFDGFRLLLPMGISFYVFQTISYTIDVYRGDMPAERHLGHYALFVVFFPQLVAGPIERCGALLPQLRSVPTVTQDDTAEGVRHLVRGFAKKVLVADFLARFVDAAYDRPDQVGGAALMAATMLFAVQIYCDFSGYSDIAVGCARLMGVRLTENFARPYAAATMRDFWRRWHISLTRWFTDYVYIPLGGSRRGMTRTCVNLLLVFLLSGLWHGADVTFIIWGLLHGVYLVCERLLGVRPSVGPGRWLQRLRTWLLCGFAWVFFRADSLSHAWLVLRTMVFDLRPGAWMSGLGMTPAALLTAALLIALVPLLDRLPRCEGPHASARVLAYFLLICAIVLCRCLILMQGGDPAFIYFQF